MWAHYWHLALFMPTGWFSYAPIRIFALACVNPLFYMELVGTLKTKSETLCEVSYFLLYCGFQRI